LPNNRSHASIGSELDTLILGTEHPEASLEQRLQLMKLVGSPVADYFLQFFQHGQASRIFAPVVGVGRLLDLVAEFSEQRCYSILKPLWGHL